MKYPTNTPEYLSRRKVLRKNQTLVELLLWSRLRNHQLNGVKFYRQFGVGNYIIDFYSHQYKLAIELDGNQHLQPKNSAYDLRRTIFLKTHGITVLRFWDTDVIKNLDGVLQKILNYLNSRK